MTWRETAGGNWEWELHDESSDDKLRVWADHDLGPPRWHGCLQLDLAPVAWTMVGPFATANEAKEATYEAAVGFVEALRRGLGAW